MIHSSLTSSKWALKLTLAQGPGQPRDYVGRVHGLLKISNKKIQLSTDFRDMGANFGHSKAMAYTDFWH